MYKVLLIGILAIFTLAGCASGTGGTSVGPHGTESTLSDNKLEGLYLFKIETNQNHLNITSRGDVKVGM